MFNVNQHPATRANDTAASQPRRDNPQLSFRTSIPKNFKELRAAAVFVVSGIISQKVFEPAI